ncbi:putative nucleotidyltransferase-like protein [Knoellia remsis]|uniref:Putative nucleotidyltransferase-like protein n=1 Tax=Knoellia remsis TaxID=407159 RepID=A0A2T0UZ43_9MICO|nr:putative nucleotidyltransferase-like protein [Knoellia remsis]
MPLHVRVELAHGATQVLANQQKVDLLHIKGPAVAEGLRRPGTASTDADVLVRPQHVPRFMAGLERTGWILRTDFRDGSAFEHAAGLYHPHWGLLDVHRRFPGMDRDPEHTFEVLWGRREHTRLAAIDVAVPDRTGQQLVLLLHVARSEAPAMDQHPDHAVNWGHASEQDRQAVVELAREVHAEVALAAATDQLDAYDGDPEAALWRVFSRPGHTRLEEWRARVQAAPTRRAKVGVALRAFLVNKAWLAEDLGRPPTRADMVRAFGGRFVQGARDLGRMSRRSAQEHLHIDREGPS